MNARFVATENNKFVFIHLRDILALLAEAGLASTDHYLPIRFDGDSRLEVSLPLYYVNDRGETICRELYLPYPVEEAVEI